MKRGQWRSLGTAFAALCLFLFAFAAIGQTTVRVVNINDAHWKSDLVIAADSGAVSLNTSDCAFFPFTKTLPLRGEALIENFGANLAGANGQCTGSAIGVAELQILSGSPRVWTEATFSDGVTKNVVAIPDLPPALLPSDPAHSYSYEFSGIENRVDGKSTFLAFFTAPNASTRVTLTITDSDNLNPKTETFDVDGFLFAQIATAVRIGHVTVTNTPIVFGCQNCSFGAPVYAVAFVGRPEGGSPRVEVPALSIATP